MNQLVHPPDEALVRAWNQGGEAAFTAIYERYAQRVFSFLCRLTGESGEAEELLQETFYRVVRGLASFDVHRDFRPWLYSIAINVFRDNVRGRRPQVQYREVETLEGPTARAGSILEDVLQAELAAAVRKGIVSLPPEHRTVLTLRHYEGLSYQEIAELLDCPIGTVRSRIHYAVVSLRDHLAKKGLLDG